jgi:hypothetical protein
MNKQWFRRSERIFEFSTDGVVIGTMEIVHGKSNSRAICAIGALEFTIKPTSALTTSIDIADIGGEPIAIVRTEHWYSDHSIMEFEGKKYILRLHNDPLATWSVFLNEKKVLSYGLHSSSGKLSINIKGSEEPNSPILDFVLWYLFLPIAMENVGQMLEFSDLTSF